jgi:hypothetical protein
VLANAWASFSLPQLFYQKIYLFRKSDGAALPHENSNNPLAVNPKAKMMRTVRIISAIFYCGEAAASCDDKDLFK